MVVDHERQFVGYVTRGVARKALREKRATMWRRTPPVLRLAPGDRDLPRFVPRERTKNMFNRDGSNVTPFPKKEAGPIAQGPAVNWFNFLKEEREIWIQNISRTQLSLQFENGSANPTCECIPVGPDPVCITNSVEFSTLRKSQDFKKLLTRVPSVMRLMTSEQAFAYYTDKAQALNAYSVGPDGQAVPDVGAAIEHAERERRALTSRQIDMTPSSITAADGSVYFAPPQSVLDTNPAVASDYAARLAAAGHTAAEQTFAAASPFPVSQPFDLTANLATPSDARTPTPEEFILPRVLYLCQQVADYVPAHQRMSAEELFGELKKLGDLDDANLQYVYQNGRFKTVKKWARALIDARLAAIDGEEGIEDNLSP